jgi:hypothetical protein
MAVFSIFWTGTATFLSSSSSVVFEVEWTPFQTHYFFFLVVLGIEPGLPDL